MSAKKLAFVGAQKLLRNAKNLCCNDADLSVVHSWGTRVYRRGTGPGWPPLGATTVANEPHTQLGLFI